MTAQLPATSFAFSPLSTSAYHHDLHPSTANSEHSLMHDPVTMTTMTAHPHDSSSTHNSDSTPFSSTATPSSSYFSHSQTSPPLSNSDEIPKLGSIRCYWTVLSPSLDYVYLDPLLEHHLGEQAQQFLGSNLLDFVHPDERDQLAEDLLPRPDRIAGVETAGVFGSVTRLRYSRLVGILRKLGCLEVPTLPDADKYALDEDYCKVDLTTSWIAGNGITRGNSMEDGSREQLGQGAVLAFFHVVGDKDHVKNNDQHERGDWTNWCGVQLDEHRYFTPSRCQALVDVLERITSSPSRPSTAGGSEEENKSALLASLHGLSSETTDGPPPHVFQILDRNGKTIVSFPTPQDESGRKRYEVESYAALAREVVARPRGAANAKTSCTKRYRSKHPVMKDSILTTIESVVIMYGSITFACFQTGGIYLTSAKKTALGLNAASMSPSPAAHDFNLEDVPATVANPKNFINYNKRPTPYLGSPPFKRPKIEVGDSSPARSRLAMPLSNGLGSQDSKDLSISTAFNPGSYRPSVEPEYGTNGGVSPTVASASAILGAISSSTSAVNQSDATPSSSAQSTEQQYHPHSSSSTFPYFRPQGASPASLYPPAYPSYSATSPQQRPESQTQGYFPPPASQASSSSANQAQQATPNGPSLATQQYRDPSQDLNPLTQNGANGTSIQNGEAPSAQRELKTRRSRPDGPVFKPGPKACESCGTTESPEWRKGPSGSKSLCNACGLRHARTVARQKKLAEQAASGIPPKKKKSKKAAKEGAKFAVTAPPSASSAPASSSLPPTSSAHTNYEPAFSRSDSVPTQKAYSPYYTSAPPHSSSYAIVASHNPTSSGPPLSTSAVSIYPSSTSGYHPATTTYPFSTYPPTSTPILTHIPIHHTLAATLAPLSAPVSVHSHDYQRNGPIPTSIPHSSAPYSASSDHYASYSQASDHSGIYHQSQQTHHQLQTSSAGGDWQPSYTSAEIHHPTSSSAPPVSSIPSSQPLLAPSSYTTSSASPHHTINAHSSSPHLHHPQPVAYQPYQGWSQEPRHNSNGNGNDVHHNGQGGGGGSHDRYE
ncbi:uncharacterized protein JCM6883_003972 [Sporobolomyces salmoneus]|uniref:uncharacterized protein n=1 Tax=Sporobolomyces salmoneus TaxID=183962 RepID=UPI003177BA61